MIDKLLNMSDINIISLNKLGDCKSFFKLSIVVCTLSVVTACGNGGSVFSTIDNNNDNGKKPTDISNPVISVQLDAPETLVVKNDWQVISTNEEAKSVSVADVDSEQFSPLEDDERSSYILIDENEEPRMAAINFAPKNGKVKVDIDTTTQFFILKHPILIGSSFNNEELNQLISQMQQTPEYPVIKEEMIFNIENSEPCPLSHDCNSYASQKAEELLLSLPMLKK